MSIDPSNIANPATIGSVAQPIGRRCLVINADDLGFSQQVNAAIDQALARGWISSSTLMANAPCCEEGVAVAQRHRSHASFGIHLNLTEFKPLTKTTELQRSGLLDEGGLFSGSIRELRGRPETMAACFDELDAQIQQVRSMGLEISPFRFPSPHTHHSLDAAGDPQAPEEAWDLADANNNERLRPQAPQQAAPHPNPGQKAWSTICRLRAAACRRCSQGWMSFWRIPLANPFNNQHRLS